MQCNIIKNAPRPKNTLLENKENSNITIKTKIEWYKYIAKRYKTQIIESTFITLY